MLIRSSEKSHRYNHIKLSNGQNVRRPICHRDGKISYYCSEYMVMFWRQEDMHESDFLELPPEERMRVLNHIRKGKQDNPPQGGE
jgi:hypothetical protein